MDDLAAIAGPWFLLFYAVAVAAAAWFARRWAMPAGAADLPDPDALPPAELALLRDGPHGAVAVTLFRLVERGQVAVEGERADRLVARPGAQGGDDWERALLRLLPPGGCSVATLFPLARGDLRLLALAEEARGRLRERGLLRDAGQRQAAWMRTLMVLGAVGGLGAAKVSLGLSRGRPVGFLIALMVLAVPVIVVAARPWFRRTAAGETFLARAADHFRRWLPRAPPPALPAAAPATAAAAPARGPDPAFAVAACGVAVLAMVPGWNPLSAALAPPPGSGGGGCGSGGCGSTGCEAGDSDGGSDGGGGGCGGCGGGD